MQVGSSAFVECDIIIDDDDDDDDDDDASDDEDDGFVDERFFSHLSCKCKISS